MAEVLRHILGVYLYDDTLLPVDSEGIFLGFPSEVYQVLHAALVMARVHVMHTLCPWWEAGTR